MYVYICRGTDYGTTAEHKRSSAMPSQGSLFTNFEDVQVSRIYMYILCYFHLLHIGINYQLTGEVLNMFAIR